MDDTGIEATADSRGGRCDCEQYASHPRENVSGDVTDTVPDDIAAVEREHGVPESFESCHTTVVGDRLVDVVRFEEGRGGTTKYDGANTIVLSYSLPDSAEPAVEEMIGAIKPKISDARDTYRRVRRRDRCGYAAF